MIKPNIVCFRFVLSSCFRLRCNDISDLYESVLGSKFKFCISTEL